MYAKCMLGIQIWVFQIDGQPSSREAEIEVPKSPV